MTHIKPPPTKKPIISVFGSSAPPPGSADYELARQMGYLLAEAGYAVQTGGYSGVMAGVSQGAALAGGHIIGITSAQVETYRPIPANAWVQEEIKYPTLSERLAHLVTQCQGAIVMPGGVGTLGELALMWNLIQIGEREAAPLIAVGGLWAKMLDAFIDSAYVQPEVAALVQIAKTPAEALKLLQNSLKQTNT